MKKKLLVDSVLAGRPVARPPVSLWYHFGIQHGGGRQFAQTSLEYFHYYDFDFLKVMNDYFYPSPEGLEAVRTRQDLQKLTRFDVQNSPWQEQFKAIELIAGALKEEAYFIDTVFDAWQSLNRNLAAENMKHLMADEPDALLEALDRVSDNLIDYCKIVLSMGAAGIFFSIPAGSEIVTRDEFLTFVKPFARKVLEAVQPHAVMNTLHVHGQNLFFDDVIDLPAHVFNWWDRGPDGPSLSSVLARIPGGVMGGIDQTIVARRTRAFLKSHVQEALRLGGDRRFFLANGCTIDSWVYPGALKTVVEAAR
jgi:uroporphyrinogen decarboxylase